MGKYADAVLNEKPSWQTVKRKYSASLDADAIPEPQEQKAPGEFGPSFLAAMAEDPATKERLLQGTSDKGMAAVAGKFASYAPEVIGGAVGARLGGLPGAALGGGAAVAGKKLFANQVLDEPQDPMENATAISFEAIMNTVFGLAGKTVNKFRELRSVDEMAKLDMPALEVKRQVLKQSTGIDLDLAQLSNSPTLKSWKRFVTNMPGEASEIMLAFEQLQKGQATDAVAKLAAALSPETLSKAQGQHGINAAKEIIELAKQARQTAVKPFYDQAGKVVLSNDVVETFAKDPVLASAMRRVMAVPAFKKELGSLPENSVGAWHLVMQQLGDQITKAPPKLKRILTDSQANLRKSLEAASPEFKAAQAYYAKTTQQIVAPLEKSIIGALAEIPGNRARMAAKALFDGSFPDTEGVKAARQAFEKLEAASPDMAGSWNGLVRQWLETNLNAASRVGQTGTVQNLPGKMLQRIAGTPQQRAALEEAVGPGANALLKDVLEALQHAARTPTISSQTTFNQIAREQLTAGTLRSNLRLARKPIETVIESGDQKMLERHAAGVAEALTDPTKRQILMNLRKLPDSSKKWTLFWSVLTGQTLGATGAVALWQ